MQASNFKQALQIQNIKAKHQITDIPKNLGRDIMEWIINAYPGMVAVIDGKDGLDSIFTYYTGKFSNLQQNQSLFMELAAKALEKYRDEHAKELSEDKLLRIDKIIKRLVEDPAWTRVLIKAASRPELRIDERLFNSKPGQILLENGVVNLASGILRDASPEDLLTINSPISYDPEATAPEWMRVIYEIFDGDDQLIHQFHKAMGSTLSAEMPEFIFFFIGKGANGKSLITDILMSILGDYSSPAPSSIIIQKPKQHISSDLNMLNGKYVVIITEIPVDGTVDEHSIKSIVGTRTSVSRAMYKDFTRVENTAKIIVSLNEMPAIKDFTMGLYRRIMLFEFKVSFLGREDTDLYDRLVSNELPGIVNWLVAGYQAFKKEGLHQTEEMLNALDHYMSLSDPLYGFIKEMIVNDPKAKTWTKDIIQAYRAWEQSSNPAIRLSDDKLYKELSKRFLAHKGKSSDSLYHGLKLKSRTPEHDEVF